MKEKKTTIEGIIERQEQIERRLEESEKEFRKAVSVLFNSKEGVIFLKYMKKICKVDRVLGNSSPQDAIYNRALNDVYHGLITEFVPLEIRERIERQ